MTTFLWLQLRVADVHAWLPRRTPLSAAAPGLDTGLLRSWTVRNLLLRVCMRAHAQPAALHACMGVHGCGCSSWYSCCVATSWSSMALLLQAVFAF